MRFFGDKAKNIRRSLELTSEDFAKKMGIDRTTLSAWENGRRIPSEVKVRLISKTMNVSLDQISDLEPDKPTSKTDFAASLASISSMSDTNGNDYQNKIDSLISGIKNIGKEIKNEKIIIDALTTSLSSIFYIKDTNLKYILANNLFLENISLNKDFSVFNKTDYDLFPISDAKINEEEDRQVISSGKPISNKEIHIPGSRKKKWGLISKIPIIDSTGKVEGIIGSFVDITERKKIEEVYNNLFIMSSDLICTIGEDGYFKLLNSAWEKTLGYTNKEILAKPFLSFVHPDDQAKTAYHTANLSAGNRRLNFSNRYVHKDGSIVYILWTVNTLSGEKLIYGIGKDITELKMTEDNLQVNEIELEMQNQELSKAKAELEVSRAKYFDLYDLAPVGYFTLDENRVIIEANLKASSMLSITKDSLPKNPFSKLIIPEDKDIFYLRSNEVLVSGTNQEFEIRLFKKEGTIFWVKMTLSSMLDSRNKQQFMATISDITERKKAENKIESMAIEWQRTFNSLAGVVFLLDDECIILQCNKSAELFLNKPRDAIIGRHCWELVHGTAGPIPGCPLPEMKLDLKRKVQVLQIEGKFFQITVDPILDENGNLTGAVHIIDDITERKHIELRLQKEKEFNQALLSSLPVGVVACDDKGKLTLFNNVSSAWHGIDAINIPPEKWAIHYSLCGADGVTPLSLTEIPLFRAFSGESVKDVEMSIVNKGKPPRYITATGTAFYDANMKKLGAVVVMNDITERKRLETELIENKDMALAASNAKSEFIANMNHELRTPLNSVLGFAQVLQHEYLGKLNEQQMERINNILTSGDLLLSLINSVLDLSRIEAGKIELNISKVNLASLTNKINLLFREKAIAHTTELDFKISPDLPVEFEIDGIKFSQVIINLISNAFKFTPTGGKIIFEAVKISGNKMMISVTDNGPGISQEDQLKLFAPFEKLKSKKPGAGLGLALCKRIVDLWDGYIGVVSPPEGSETGCRFYFDVPLKITDSTLEGSALESLALSRPNRNGTDKAVPSKRYLK